MSDAPNTQVWTGIIGALEDLMPPEWSRQARESGDTSWMRAILLVDAHDRLVAPAPLEHVSRTLHDLAKQNGNDAEAAGWEALHMQRREARRLLLVKIEELGPTVVDGEPAVLLARALNTVAVV